MRNKLTFYLILAIVECCFVFINSGVTVLAQSFDYKEDGRKIFGSSLKKTDKKSKDKSESKKQNINSADADEIIRVETTLIVNDISVFDKHGNPISGLKKEDFIVKEDDKIQEIKAFSAGDGEAISRSIVLIIDYSFSQLPYIKTSIEAAKALVDRLNPNDRLAIVTDNVELLQDFTSDKTLLKEKLESLKMNALSGKLGHSRQYMR